VTDQASTPTINELLDDALIAPADQRVKAIGRLAAAIADEDPVFIGSVAEQLKDAKLVSKRDFWKSVDKARKRRQHADGSRMNRRGAPPDDELAKRWIAAHPHTAYGLGEFRRYADGIWSLIPVDTIKVEIAVILEQAKPEGIRPTISRLTSVLELARMRISIPDEKWDANADLIPCKNGTFHISSFSLEPHDPKNLFTTGLGFDYDPQAGCPSFMRVLQTTVPDAMEFIQEFAGYSLTTDTKYEAGIWLYGPPGCGKSTLLRGLEVMLGVRAGVLGLAEIERSRFALASLPGKTLVISTEQPGGHMSSTHTLNGIISGERIEVDRKFRDAITIIPRVKIVWSMNDLPRVSEANNGLFRRIKVIRFPALSESARDPNLKRAIEDEGPGILIWALAGLKRLTERGKFEIPSAVQEATAQFQENNDIPRYFVAERCLKDPAYRIQSSTLYAAYRDWCIENGHKPKSSTGVAEDWRRLGFEKYLADGRSYWRGIGLMSLIK
jgi:putative DNA primase/helicase